MTLVMKKQSSSEACSECGVVATSLFFRGKTVGGRGLLLISSTFFFNFFSQCQLGGCPQQHLEVKDRGRGVCVTTNIGIICLKGHRRLMGQKKGASQRYGNRHSPQMSLPRKRHQRDQSSFGGLGLSGPECVAAMLLAAVAAQVGLLQVLLRRVQHWSIGVLCPDEPKNPSKKSITNLTYTVLRSQES